MPDTAFTVLTRVLIGGAALVLGFLAGRTGADRRNPPAGPAAAAGPVRKESRAKASDPGEFAPLDDRLAALAAVRPEALDKLQQRIGQQAAKDRRAGAPDELTDHRLRLLMDRRTAEDPQAARRSLEETADSDYYARATAAFYEAWAVKEPAAALAAVGGVMPPSLRTATFRRMITAAVRSDPAAAFAADSPAGIPVHELRCAVLEAWAARDPRAAMAAREAAKTARKDTSGPSHFLQGRALTRGWLLADPAGALAFAETADFPPPDLSGVTAAPERLALLYEHLGKQADSAAAVQRLTKLTAGTAAPAAARRVAAESPAEMESYFRWLLTTPYDFEAALIEAAKVLSWQSEGHAVQLLAGAPVGPAGNAALAALLENWLAADAAALTGFLRSAPAGGTWDALRAGVLRRLADQSPETVLTTAEGIGLDAVNRDTVIGGIMPAVCTLAPGAAEQWLDAHPDFLLPEPACQPLLTALSTRDPAHALRWALGRKLPFPRQAVITALTGPWIVKDRGAALKWIDSLTDSGERDAATVQLVNADMGITDQFFAKTMIPQSFERVLRLTDRRARIMAIRTLLNHSASMGNDISEMLGHRSLKEADRAAVLSDKDP